MHEQWLHNTPRPCKGREGQAAGPQYVPVIANDYTWYRQLDKNRKEVRILFIEPERQSSTKEVVVHVFNASLLDPGVPKLYGCLSYCWGDPSITKAIQVVYTEKSQEKGQGPVTTQVEFRVTANLEAALRAFRSQLRRPVMWADALCIDQSDIAERSSQVSLMGEIYLQAVQTIVWLGNADTTTKAVFDFADFITTMEVKPHEVNPSTMIAGINCRRLRPLAKGETQFTAAEVTSDDFYKMRWGIQAILARPFFRRAWVLQEVGLADREQTVVYCGQHSLWWQTLQNLTSFEWRAAAHQGPLPIDQERDRRLRLPTDNASVIPGAHFTLPEIWSYLRRYCSNTMRGKIIDLIFRRLDIEATDPRDHVFALFGLAEECQTHLNLHSGFCASYSSDVAEVYTLFTRAAIEKLENLVVLSALDVFASSDSRLRYDLPTWVPDFSSNMNLRRTLGYLGMGEYRASGTSRPCTKLQDRRVLNLSGFRIDEISSESDWGPFRMEVRTDNVNNTTVPAVLDVPGQQKGIQFLWRMISQRIKITPIAQQELLETFILTLMCSRRTFFDRATITSIADIPDLLADFVAYWISQVGTLADLPPRTVFYNSTAALLELAKKGLPGRFGQRLFYTCHERSFLVTERGLLALVPPGTANGDIVVVCEGANVPYVVRKVPPAMDSSALHFRFTGECYVHGRMEGSTISELEQGSLKREMLSFV